MEQVEGIKVDGDKYAEIVGWERLLGGPGGIIGAMEKYNVDLFAVLSDWGIANDIAAKVEFPVMSVTLGYLPEETPVEHAQSLSFKRPDCRKNAPYRSRVLCFSLTQKLDML